MTAASSPRPPFSDVGSLKSHELYAFAGIVPKMPERVRAVLRRALAIEVEFGTRAEMAECRALLDTMEAGRG